jgi:hypothetical protein
MAALVGSYTGAILAVADVVRNQAAFESSVFVRVMRNGPVRSKGAEEFCVHEACRVGPGNLSGSKLTSAVVKKLTFGSRLMPTLRHVPVMINSLLAASVKNREAPLVCSAGASEPAGVLTAVFEPRKKGPSCVSQLGSTPSLRSRSVA